VGPLSHHLAEVARTRLLHTAASAAKQREKWSDYEKIQAKPYSTRLRQGVSAGPCWALKRKLPLFDGIGQNSLAGRLA
jgi:hypothetical protein